MQRLEQPAAPFSCFSLPNRFFSECPCPPDPNTRIINLVGNLIQRTSIDIVERLDYRRRFNYSTCKPLLDVSRTAALNIFPQSCGEEKYLTIDLQCQSCYSAWGNDRVQDVEGWGQALRSFGLTFNQTDLIARKSYETCSKCDQGSRQRRREVIPIRDCSKLRPIVCSPLPSSFLNLHFLELILFALLRSVPRARCSSPFLSLEFRGHCLLGFLELFISLIDLFCLGF